MKSILVAFISLIILVPLLFFLPLGLSLQGKIIMISAAFLLAVVGIFSSEVVPIWLVGILLLVLIVFVSIILETRLKRVIFAQEKGDFVPNHSFPFETPSQHESRSFAEWNLEQKQMDVAEEEKAEMVQQVQMEEIQIETENNISLQEVAALQEESDSIDEIEELSITNTEDEPHELEEVSLNEESLAEGQDLSLSNGTMESQESFGEKFEEYTDEELFEFLEHRESQLNHSLEKTDEAADESSLVELEKLMESDEEQIDSLDSGKDEMKLQHIGEEESLTPIELFQEQKNDLPIEEKFPLEEKHELEEIREESDDIDPLETIDNHELEINISEIDNLNELEKINKQQTEENLAKDEEDKSIEFEGDEKQELMERDKTEINGAEEEKVERSFAHHATIDNVTKIEEPFNDLTMILSEEEKKYIESMNESDDEIYIDEKEKSTLNLFNEFTDEEDEAIDVRKYFQEEETNRNADRKTETSIQQQVFETILAQVELARGQLKDEKFEQLVKAFLHPSLPEQHYYTLSTILIEHYIRLKEKEKLHHLLEELKEKYIQYPIVNEQITYLYEHYFSE